MVSLIKYLIVFIACHILYNRFTGRDSQVEGWMVKSVLGLRDQIMKIGFQGTEWISIGSINIADIGQSLGRGNSQETFLAKQDAAPHKILMGVEFPFLMICKRTSHL